MGQKKIKNKPPYKLFGVLFVLLMTIAFINNLRKKDVIALGVPNNLGVSGLKTVDNSLVCVFQDGRIVTWDWNSHEQKGDFNAASDRVAVLDTQHIAAVNKESKKMQTVYALPSGKKESEMSVGWEDQDVWPRISPDKQTLALVRKNVPDAKDRVMFEFLTVNVKKELLSLPVTLSILQDTEEFVDYAVDNNGVLYIVGSTEKKGRIVAVDLEQGEIIWDTVFEGTKEFCSIMTSPDKAVLYAGNRDGILYKLDAKSGEIVKKIELLEKGETRPITNDYSVLNLAFSPDGQYFVATIHPKAYLLDTESDKIIHTATPANKLVSKIAFSPDNKFFATSDIRASYPIKIWPMPQEK